MADIQNIIHKDNKYLDKKQPHTNYKIKYVSEYVKRWTYIACVSEVSNINFIDCMCNAGVYADGDYCSATEVFMSFVEAASKYKEKHFNLFLNDYDDNRIRIIKEVLHSICNTLPNNLHVYYENEDVNVYLKQLINKHPQLFKYPSRTVLYVDPYDFHTVIIENLSYFIASTYCELLFNLFTSDYLRNKDDAGIQKVLGGSFSFNSIDALVEHIKTRLKVGKMKFLLAYPFRQSKNVELYRIVFVSPHPKGVDKLKETLWQVFEGDRYFRTDSQKESGQLSLFSSEENREMTAKFYAEEIKNKLVDEFKTRIVDFYTIALYVCENSLFASTQIVKYVIKPLIVEGRIVKLNRLNRLNYKEEDYRFK